MSIPQRARDLRKAFDAQNLYTSYTPGVRGFAHQIRVTTQENGNYILVTVYGDRYRVIDTDDSETRYTEIPDVVEKVQSLLDGR